MGGCCFLLSISREGRQGSLAYPLVRLVLQKFSSTYTLKVLRLLNSLSYFGLLTLFGIFHLTDTYDNFDGKTEKVFKLWVFREEMSSSF